MVGGVASGIASAYNQKKTTGKISAKETLKAAGKGAVVGAVGGVTGAATAVVGSSLALGALGATAATATVGQQAAANFVGGIAAGFTARGGSAIANNALAKDESELVDVKSAIFDQRAAVMDVGLSAFGATAPMWAGGKSSTSSMTQPVKPSTDLAKKANSVASKGLVQEGMEAVDDGLTSVEASVNQAVQENAATICDNVKALSEGEEELIMRVSHQFKETQILWAIIFQGFWKT